MRKVRSANHDIDRTADPFGQNSSVGSHRAVGCADTLWGPDRHCGASDLTNGGGETSGTGRIGEYHRGEAEQALSVARMNVDGVLNNVDVFGVEGIDRHVGYVAIPRNPGGESLKAAGRAIPSRLAVRRTEQLGIPGRAAVVGGPDAGIFYLGYRVKRGAAVGRDSTGVLHGRKDDRRIYRDGGQIGIGVVLGDQREPSHSQRAE